jgi:hypothetical protein
MKSGLGRTVGHRVTHLFIAVVLMNFAILCIAETRLPEQAITYTQILDTATEISRSSQVIELTPDGRARMTAPMQRLEILVDQTGLDLFPIDQTGPRILGWELQAYGRGHSDPAQTSLGEIAIANGTVTVSRDGVNEKLAADGGGLRHHITLMERSESGTGELIIEYGARAAQFIELPQSEQSIVMQSSDGRTFYYRALKVADANDRQLPVRMEVKDASTMRINIDDRQASYPIRIESAISDADWEAIITPAMNGEIRAVAVAGNDLYLGGTFTLTPDGVIWYIARWNGSEWSALGEGMNGFVNALAWDAENEALYAAGSFTLAGGVEANRIARWDGQEWSSLGSGTSSRIDALAWVPGDGHLYAGGYFTSAGGVPANRIARWDGASWTALGGGLQGGNVLALAWDEANGHLYAGGSFDTAGDHEARRVARWDGNDWIALGGGVFSAFSDDSSVRALAWDGNNDRLIVGGNFSRAGTGIFARNIAIWDGTEWFEPDGGGLGGNTVHALMFNADTGRLYAGGAFTSAGTMLVSGIASWDGSSWSRMDDSIGGVPYAMAWDPDKEILHVGGDFTTAGDIPANRLAHWDGNAWHGEYVGMTGMIEALLWDPVNQHLYVGGGNSPFSGDRMKLAADGRLVRNLARWDGNVWSALGDGPEFMRHANGVSVLAQDPANENLYVGMRFNTGFTAIFPDAIARWDGTQWHALGKGIRGGDFHSVNALHWDVDNSHLYVGGEFFRVNGDGDDSIIAGGIARWDGNSWAADGCGVSGGPVNLVGAIDWDAAHQALYIAVGRIPYVCGVEVSGMARRHENEWHAVHGEESESEFVGAFARDQADNQLYAGGGFLTAGETHAIARWDGTDWHGLGAGLGGIGSPRVNALVWDSDRQHLYVGGNFRTAGGASAWYVARWDGDTWSPLGSGTSWLVHAMAWDPENRQLYVGGLFSWAGDQLARVARFETRMHQDPPMAITAEPQEMEIGSESILTTSGGAGTGEITLAVTAGTENCSIDGNIVRGIAVGSCNVTATRDGDSDFRPSSDTVEITVTPGVFFDRFQDW